VIALPSQFADSPPFSLENLSTYDHNGPAWYWNVLHAGEHTGTHFDAPIHWITGRNLPANSCETIPVEHFIGPAAVVDACAEVGSSPDYLLDIERILEWERRFGRLRPGSWVLMRTDWSKRTSRDAFLNQDGRGAHSPGFACDAVRFLVHERNVLGIGVETVGIDPGQADRFVPPFPNHAFILGAGRYGLASLWHLDQLPATGSIIIAAPLKIVAGSGSPIRAIALVPKDTIP
jgi:kynurenine formamidase